MESTAAGVAISGGPGIAADPVPAEEPGSKSLPAKAPPSPGWGFNEHLKHWIDERRAPGALLIPLVCLFASVCLFVASLLFYCSRAGSDDCFESLLGFLSLSRHIA